MSIDVIKAHAYGNDFLFAPTGQAGDADQAALARQMCDRHHGIGADGLVLYEPMATGARMTLYNADGGVAEVSGNAVRCLAAIVARERPDEEEIVIHTAAGAIPLGLIAADGRRWTFEALMRSPEGLRQRTLEVLGAPLEVVELSVGNPQCIVLGGPLDAARLHQLGPALATHAAYPDGTNVELVEVETPSRIRILIWERGVGPTEASGTGACASAVAAAAYGGADRAQDVVAPGGTQHVDWTDDGIRLTGWAEIVLAGHWHP